MRSLKNCGYIKIIPFFEYLYKQPQGQWASDTERTEKGFFPDNLISQTGCLGQKAEVKTLIFNQPSNFNPALNCCWQISVSSYHQKAAGAACITGDWAPVNYAFITSYLNWKKQYKLLALPSVVAYCSESGSCPPMVIKNQKQTNTTQHQELFFFFLVEVFGKKKKTNTKCSKKFDS